MIKRNPLSNGFENSTNENGHNRQNIITNANDSPFNCHRFKKNKYLNTIEERQSRNTNWTSYRVILLYELGEKENFIRRPSTASCVNFGPNGECYNQTNVTFHLSLKVCSWSLLVLFSFVLISSLLLRVAKVIKCFCSPPNYCSRNFSGFDYGKNINYDSALFERLYESTREVTMAPLALTGGRISLNHPLLPNHSSWSLGHGFVPANHVRFYHFYIRFFFIKYSVFL